MSPLAGSRLGPYEILSPIGAGGMGDVYKARDTRLERFVAIKVLHVDHSADPDRRRRFEQEARAASALNHPNIVTIYDVGSDNGVDFLAMEYVVGRTLAEAIPPAGLSLPDLLKLAVQVADALATAHAAGIVHRDLKPGNVMVTSEGLVKVVDFGLAKLAESPGGPVAGQLQTADALTAQGQIVGTLSFMSPEQAEGRPVDGRSDVFAFGAMLYEMATGHRAFAGDTAIATIAAILRDEPKPVAACRPETPAELVRIITRCLRKDPSRRFQTMADLKVALKELEDESGSGALAVAPASTTAPARSIRRTVWLLATVGLVAAVIAGGWWLATWMPPPEMQRPVVLTSYSGDESDPSFSPDGGQIAFAWNGDRQDNYDIYVKVVGLGAPLRLTTDPAADFSPKWSPDGRTVAFGRLTPEGTAVILIPALGGPERRLALFQGSRSFTATAVSTLSNILSWSPDGKSLVAAGSTGAEPARLHVITVETGDIRPLTNPPAGTEGDTDPAVSPDGRSLAFVRTGAMNLMEIWVVRVSDALRPAAEPRKLPVEGTFARNPVWTADGREILYASGTRLRSNIYRRPAEGSGPSHLIERLGDGVEGPTLSYASRRLVFSHELRNSNIYRLDLAAKPPLVQQLISSTFREAFPQYAPDGKRIVFYSNRSGVNQIWACDADGTRAAQLTSMAGDITGSPRWSPDGTQISFDSNTGGHWQIYVMDAQGGKPRALTDDASANVIASWSRDGRWVYYMSKRSGREEVWKIPARGGAAVQVTRRGGAAGVESVDGRTLFFVKTGDLSGATTLWRMPVDGGEEEVQIAPAVFRYNFAVTEQGVYYDTPAAPDRPSAIHFLDFASGSVTRLYTLTKPADLGLAVSPDRRYLLFAQNDFFGNDLMLVENFR